ncbi:MAG: VacJ lipoprotein [Cypionkella sp.]|uniref:MlaA family lipoprotein n=1 Tax=Cypionkella sp. TaxID=2811411 RepID=UPI0026150173|nr:VacJ family lipoprotein [Cypionkella sp.]MDB5660792.1 VacJ lipoprotein [Cypionkella sp.]MDB5666473.1 VacJ lipoprotein [Cypionkella sp.]
MAALIPSLSEVTSTIAAGCVGIACLLMVAGCAKAPTAPAMSDPNEALNRRVFAFNVALDKAVLQPVAGVAGNGRGPILTGVHNFANNLDTPGDIVNNVLQLRLMRAARNTLRFAVNSTAGIGGLFDPSTALGLPAQETDFGETLYVWGVGEGNYQMLPIVGPSTERDTAGVIVDYAINPLRFLLDTPESHYVTGVKVIDTVGSRARHSDTVDSILYDSADPYAQARLLYLQNRHYTLGEAPSDESFEDPYAQ